MLRNNVTTDVKVAEHFNDPCGNDSSKIGSCSQENSSGIIKKDNNVKDTKEKNEKSRDYNPFVLLNVVCGSVLTRILWFLLMVLGCESVLVLAAFLMVLILIITFLAANLLAGGTL